MDKLTETEENLVTSKHLYCRPTQVWAILNNKRPEEDQLEKSTVTVTLFRLRKEHRDATKEPSTIKRRAPRKMRVPVPLPPKEMVFASTLSRPSDTGDFVDHREFDIYYK